MKFADPATIPDVAKLVRDFADAVSTATAASQGSERICEGTNLGAANLQNGNQSPEILHPACTRSADELADAQLSVPAIHSFQELGSEHDPPETDFNSYKIIEEFCCDQENLDRSDVSASELQALREVRLCGVLSCQQDVLRILHVVRNSAALGAMVEKSPAGAWYEAGPNFSALANRIRREALARLEEQDASDDSARGTDERKTGTVCSALLLPGRLVRGCLVKWVRKFLGIYAEKRAGSRAA
jgi:hypothetical protein